MTSASPTRKYTIGVILVGVAGAALVPLFIWFASARIEGITEAELGDVAIRHGRYFQRGMERCLQALEAPDGTSRDPRLQKTWSDVADALDDTLSDLPALVGLSIRGPGWRHQVGGNSQDLTAIPFLPPASRSFPHARAGADLLVVAFSCPAGAGPDASVEVNAVIRPWTLDERRLLLGLVTYGAGALGVVLYLLAALVLLVNRAQTRLINQEREKATRLKAMAEVAGSIAHEVRNPLNAVSLSVQYMERLFDKGAKAPSGADYARVHLELGKIRKVVDNFVNFARLRDLVFSPMDMGAVLDDVLTRLAGPLQAAGVQPEVTRDGDLTLAGDREKLSEVLQAVIQNALDSMNGHPRGELRIRVAGTRRWIRTTVRDTGELRDEQAIRDIFVPSFSARDSALGLGMTVARTLVESHGGTIDAAGAQGGGCVVTITLPRKRV